MKYFKTNIKLLWMSLVLCLLYGCKGPQKLFETSSYKEPDAIRMQQFIAPVDPVLKTGDKITVSIYGHNDLSVGSVNTVYNATQETGNYLVLDNDGKVNLPKLGRVKLSGLNVKEANYFLEQQYSLILTNPVINTRILNHYVTILGEVKTPGKYQLDNEGTTLIQLLGEAEGLTAYAEATHVELIRTINGEPVKLRMDFTSMTSWQQKKVPLLPNDIIYVAPRKEKRTDRELSTASIVASIVTSVAVLVSVFLK